MYRELPKGQFVVLHELDLKTTEQDIQDLIAARTGIVLPLERISLTEYERCSRAFLSMDRCHLVALVAWALSDDSCHGKPIQVLEPKPSRNAPAH